MWYVAPVSNGATCHISPITPWGRVCQRLYCICQRRGQLRVRVPCRVLLTTPTHTLLCKSNCKMGDVIKETLNVAGLLTNVYTRSNHSNSSEPVVVLFFLHGRGENADSVDSTARAAFAWVDEKQASSSQASPSKRSAPPRNFIVVTFVRGG
jgi:hypothetical protein